MHIDSNQQNGIEKYQDSGSKPQLVITGMACRLPGANNLIELAEVLSQGRDLVTTIPKSRFDIQDWYDANPDAKGKTNVKHGAFLDRFKEFDAAAFGIPPREAMALDPQQRLLLEVCQEAIDDANLGGQQRIENTGVYVGISGTDYLQLQCRQWSRSEIDAYSGTGTASSMCAGRISHQLGLRGPNLAVDTACSSSLVAMHLACQALRAGECEAALVAGVNLLLAPDPFIYLSKLKVLSADGTCKAFDAKANGYVRGEGVLAVVIQLDRGKEIAAHTRYATVSGSAMNHDGDTSGMTAPSRVAQSDLVRMALESSKLKPADIDVVEGHGTGTPLGDPIELSALNDVFGCGRSVDRPLWLSSLKTNMGHLEAAAGLAGLFKAVLQLKSECIYPHLHCVQPTPFFDWKSSPIRLPVRKQPWPQTDSPRRACISSFGFSGVNCHVVLEQVSNKRERFANANRNDRTVSPLCLSASAESSLRKQADQIAKQLESATAADLFEIGHTAAVARQHRSYRLAVIGRSVDQTKQALRQYAGTGQASPALYHGTTSKHRTNHLVFQFTGQGSWKPGIGKQIFDEEPAFRAAIHECDQLLSGRIDRPLTELLFEPPGDATTAFPQVATVVFEVALASLWREWGLSPTAVIGHSLGEYVAAWYSGIFCLEELLRAIVVRDRLIQQWCPAGAMLAVLAPQEHLTPLLNREIEVAALNGPRSTVLTGKPESVAAVRRRLTEKQIPFQQLNVGFAFHSQSVNEAAKRFREHLEDICFRPASLTLARNLDGALLPPGQTLDAEYFFQQMLSPVCYEAAVRALIRTGRNTFLELGPNSTLSNLGPAIEKDPSILWESSLKNGVDDREQLARATATLFVRGIEIDWLRRDRGYAYSPRALPAYPFERTEFFPEFGLRKEVSDSVEVESQRRSAKPEPTQLAADFDEVVQATTEPESARSLPLYLTEWIEEKHSQLSDTHGDLVLWVAGNDVAAAEKFLALGDVDQIVTPGNQWSRGDRSTSIVPDRKEHIEKVLSLFPREGSDETVLVYGWGISTDAFDDSAEQLVLGGLLAIIQCLARHSNPGQFRLIVLTKGSQRTGREVYQRDQSVESVDVEIQLSRATLGGALWGLVRVINSEHPHLRCEIVDLAGDQSNPESLDWIVHHRHELSSEPHYALRDEKRYFPRWTTIPVVNPSSLNLAPDARYIISGGLGSIGLSLAERFVERGARTLVLIGRQSANDSVLPRLQKMRQSGARVVTIAGDIASPEIVRQVLEDPSSKDLPIKGIVHAAGVLRDASLLELNLSDLSAVLAPKILGARRLRDIAAGQPLEFFVLLSSTASQLGSPGQGAYAAANSWLESFAEYEATKGINALAISLGLWGESGMAMRLSSGQLRRWQSLGFDPLHADTGLSAIETAIARTGNVCVLSANWKQFAATIPPGLEPPIVRRLFDRESNATPELLKWLSVRDKLFELSPQEQLEAACDYVNQTIHQILGISKGSAGIDRDRGFFDLGMDSVMVLEYRNRIQIAVGDTVRLPQTFAFDYPTIHRSAKFILESLHPSPSDSRQASAPRSKTSDRDGIAVIGIGCRFPGGINDADQYWQCLIDGIDAVDRVPDERRRLSAWHDDGMNDEESRVCRLGSFLAEVDQFDAEFFQVSPREARAIDPQQRLLLEVAWECLESGGLAGCRLDRETTGVFVGVSSYDYSRVLERINSISEIDRYLGTGNAPSMSAGRINHLLGFGGPAITIDTACSSSLTAVHLACDSILRGESEVALAGGVNLILSPESSLSLFRGKMLAADGRCKVFDADANGYVRGEGCGIIALKRLSAARRDGDFVHAVIRGSAVNHDGPSAGLTVPSGKSQRRLLNQAYESANVDPQEIDFVETHGTGTPLGDPIEINTLASVTSSPNRCRPLLLGAVKSNLGHLEAAAGIAGLIKSLLAVRHGVLPPNLHFHSPNQNIDWQAAKLDVVVAPTRLPTGRRIAGVSSFGFSGTNVHVVIESPSPEDDARANHSEQLSPLFLSAASPGAMHAWAAKLSRYLEVSTADEQLADFIWSCNTGRAHLSTRVVIEVSDRQSLIQSLAQVARGGEGQYQEPVTSAGRNWHLASQKFLAGGTVSSETLLGDDHRKMMALPTCAWVRQSHWGLKRTERTSTPFSDGSTRSVDPNLSESSLIGSVIRCSLLKAQVFEQRMTVSSPYWIGDHRVHEEVVIPGAAFLSMAFVAANKLQDQIPAWELTEVQFPEVLVIRPDQERLVQLILQSGQDQFRVESSIARGDECYSIHCEGTLRTHEWISGNNVPMQPRDYPHAVDGRLLYQGLRDYGIDLGDRFQWIESLDYGDGVASATFRLPRENELDDQIVLPPGIIDACFQSTAGALISRDSGHREAIIPSSVHRVLLRSGPVEHPLRCQVRLVEEDPVVANIWLIDNSDRLIGEFQRVTYQSVSPESFRRLSPNDSESTLFAEHWEQLPKELSAPDEPQRVLVLGDGKTVAGISEALDELGCQSEMLPIASLPSCTPDQSTIVMVGKGLNTDGIVSAEGAIESIYAPLLQLLSNSNQSIERLVYLESVDDPLDDFGTLARSSLHGFLRVVEMEYPGIQCRTIRINEDSSPQRVAQEVLRPENETLVIVDRDQSQAMRLLPLPTDPGPVGVFHLPKSTDGSISGLQFKSTSRRAPRAGEVEIRVATAGMNFRDVLNVLRRYPGEAGPPGCECAGEIVSVGSQHSRFQIGDSVFALVAGSFASHVTVREEFVVHRPSKLDQQVAAGIPLAWVTAKLALETRANIKCGDKILIHQASGGVGCAAIAIAKDVGADIWGTAGTESKRQFLSQLGGVNVLDSRTPDFSEAILRKTNGRGLDVVVNSLSGALARENLKVVATGGWYVELGKIDVPSEAEFLALRPDVKYSRLSVDELLSTAPQLIQACLEDLADSFASERFWLGPCKSYNVSEIQAAFRRLSEDDHVGKVVVAGFGNSHPPPRTPIRSDRSYLITGALGSIGREVSRWLVDRGAKTLILVSRNPDRGHGPAFVDELRSQGVQVRVCQGDVANKSVVASAIAPSIEGDMDPLAGVFHLAAVVNDSSIRTMSVAQLEEVMRPKLLGAHHLDLLTRDLEIEVFCLFSSIAAPFGSPTQAAYAAANAGLDALARRRRALGYPALSVQWSPWEDKSGMASGAANNMKRIWRRFGLTPLTFTKGRSILDALLNTSEAVVTVLPIDWESFSGGLGDNPTPAILKRFVQTSNKLRGDRGSLLETIRTTPRSLRESLVVERLSAEAGNLIGGTVRQDQSFAELGFDSILGIEFANRLGTILAHSFSPTRLYEYPTIAQLAKSILSSFDSEFEQHPVGQKSKKASHRFRSATDLLADIESDADSSAMKSNDERGATQ